jgi:hypothetical protein
MPDLGRPALFCFAKSRQGSVLEWSVAPDCRLCCQLTQAETRMLLVLVEAWREDTSRVGPDALPELAHGFRTSPEIGKAYAALAGRTAPVGPATVRRVFWKIKSRFTAEAVRWGAVSGHPVNTPQLFETHQLLGRRLATSRLQVIWQHAPGKSSEADG